MRQQQPPRRRRPPAPTAPTDSSTVQRLRTASRPRNVADYTARTADEYRAESAAADPDTMTALRRARRGVQQHVLDDYARTADMIADQDSVRTAEMAGRTAAAGQRLTRLQALARRLMGKKK